jgi:hypothetical protein
MTDEKVRGFAEAARRADDPGSRYARRARVQNYLRRKAT